MFGVDSTELIIVAIAALLFIGPKDLPGVMRAVGGWVGKIRGMARHFTSGIETMMREAELEEMERKWREENERIMRLYPAPDMTEDPALLPSSPPASDADAEQPASQPDTSRPEQPLP